MESAKVMVITGNGWPRESRPGRRQVRIRIRNMEIEKQKVIGLMSRGLYEFRELRVSEL